MPRKLSASCFMLDLLAICILSAFAEVFPARAQPAAWKATQHAVQSYDGFGFNLLAQLRKSFPGTNVFISPVGGALALAIAENGADGQTKDEIRKVLNIDSLTDSDEKMANANLLQSLTHINGPHSTNDNPLEIASSLWVDNGFPVKPSFIAAIQQTFQARVSNANFNNPATVPLINAWVSDHTHQTIPQLLSPPLNSDTPVVLLNAVYFKSNWRFRFNPALTADKPFILANGKTPRYPRMSETGDFLFYEDDQLQAVSLQYDSTVHMIVILPKSSLDNLVNYFSTNRWYDWQYRLTPHKGTVELPRMKLEFGYDLKSPLTALGMVRAFSGQAEFGEISDQQLYIGKAEQKTFVQVDEKGTVAGAATALHFTRGVASDRPLPSFKMVVDHPFLVAICDRETGSILFLGTIADPGQPGT